MITLNQLTKLLFILTILLSLSSSEIFSQYKKSKKSSTNIIGSPVLISTDGKYLGNYNNNTYDPNSVSNPYGTYGNPYSSQSINNPYSRYGNPYSNESVTNPYGSTDSPKLFDRDGNYLGRVNKNQFDPESINNPYSEYGNPYNPNSVKNPYGKYGNPYSPSSITSPYGSGIILNQYEGIKTDNEFNTNTLELYRYQPKDNDDENLYDDNTYDKEYDQDEDER